jgi:hypothetical protein
MKTYYRSHQLEVNATPRGDITYDIYNRSQHVLAGFSRTDLSEQAVLEKMRVRVDEMILDFTTNGPPKAPPLVAARR